MDKPISKIDVKKLDSFFTGEDTLSSSAQESKPSKHTRAVRTAKLLLPAIAAGLLGLLVLYPKLYQDGKDFSLDIKMPKKGDLEKLHIENTTFYITDKNNKVHNFTASNIDETDPGSKLIKITNPEGILPLNLASWFNVKSPTGYYDQTAETLKLQDNVEMFYSDGMNIDVPDLMYYINEGRGFSDKPVTATGFIGDLSSQGFEFYAEKNLLVFTGKTHIIVKEESLNESNSK